MTRLAASVVLAATLAACSVLPIGSDSNAEQAANATKAKAKGASASAGAAAGAAGDTAEAHGEGRGAPFSGTCGAETANAFDASDVDSFLEERMEASGAPGMAVVVIGGGKIKWKKGYGLANIEKNEAVTPDSIFMLASISKTITAISFMTLLENKANGMTLDSDVNDKLPFRVRNPQFPDVPITYRMLLTHTSSLVDSDAYDEGNDVVQGDSPIPLLDFEREYVTHDDSWGDDAPGALYSYSNMGASMLGLIVEQVTRQNLQPYAKTMIFDKIGMPETSYFLRDLDQSHIAMPYDHGTAKGFFGYPDYADGQVRTSATHLAHFLLMLAGKGACSGQRVVSEATIAEMERPQIPGISGPRKGDEAQGLILMSDQRDGVKIMGHDGADSGVSTDMWFDPATGNGYVLLTNGSANMGDNDDELNALLDLDEKLMEIANSI